MFKNNIYINEFFEPDSTFIGNRVCKNHIHQCVELSTQTIYPLLNESNDINQSKSRCMLKGKNSIDFENIAKTEKDPVLKSICLYLSFALKRLEKEKNYNKSSILIDINRILIERDRYIDSLYPEHKHNR